ncbi:hypothetical protein E4T38_07942 [Aureobasidium subglaciale]|nr:hypothetical protein E4T38_07942 [Aureobasidium subglaciale]KAI5216433.1 hypothetical protein E4T40_07952 [Aureobasidium subglaciale]KAI5219619.1 hypothetical protein E4T41_07878 [Aureobasidium subglaciale]KAI5257664.1 hypothetical protein E4T46_07843 [Aureobasidium subglaciale]
MSKQSQRLPAPSLFVGPPSHNASNASLSRANTNASQSSRPTIPGPDSPSLSHSQLSRSNTRDGVSRTNTRDTRDPPSRTQTRDALSRTNTNLSIRPDGLHPPTSTTQDEREAKEGVGLANTTVNDEVKRQRPRRGTAVLDAHWAALQSTLSDVELSASSSAHVFNSAHAKALEELRAAQVELARAWGQTDDSTTLPSSTSASASSPTKKHSTAKDQQHKNNNENEEYNDGGRKLSTTTTLDLNDAAKRREASDRYFAAVKGGVQEVVRKLDGVADAMREVEMQSRDIWGGGEGESSELTESEFGSLGS